MKNKKLSSIIQNQTLPFSFDFIEALESSSSKRKPVINTAKVLHIGEKVLLKIDKEERLFSLDARFRIQD